MRMKTFITVDNTEKWLNYLREEALDNMGDAEAIAEITDNFNFLKKLWENDGTWVIDLDEFFGLVSVLREITDDDIIVEDDNQIILS